MIRFNIALSIATLATMLYIVGVQYESRRLFVEVEKANLNVRKLEFENAALQVEKRAQATPLRIEKLAKERLNMRSALPSVTQYIQNGSNDDTGAKK